MISENQFRELVRLACVRLRAELGKHAPFLAEQVSAWMAKLSPTGEPQDYFLYPRFFPLLHLPWWAAKNFTSEPDAAFLSDVLYSTVNGYYYVRLLDNLMDGHGTIELQILPATAFFHTEFQATYQKYFDLNHGFWNVFRSSWFSANDAVTRELFLDRISSTDFEQVIVGKLGGALIPLTAVALHYGAGNRLQLWREFTSALAGWSQMEDDLFDWHQDLRQGKQSHFLTEAGMHQEFGSIQEWVIREGFQQQMEALARRLHGLRKLAQALHSPDLIHYLDLRESILEIQKHKLTQAFKVLQDVAKIIEPAAA